MRTTVWLAAVCAVLLGAGSSSAALKVGVAEDAAKGHDDGGSAMFAQLRGAGLSVVRMGVSWDETQPATIVERAKFDRALPAAAARGVTVILIISPLRPTSVTSTPNGFDRFAAFTAQVARTYPSVKHIIVGNEPNQPRFWRPQFDATGARVAAANYLQLLARSYDALKAVDPSINVIGLALSPRGNNNPTATSNASTAPVMFIRDLGEAYKASARARPIMDYAAFHPYPNPSAASEGPDKGLQWPNAGVPNTDRLQQAFWDAFHDTGQPTFAEGADGPGLRWIFDESGWQTTTAAHAGYFGEENTETVAEDVQAQFYAQMIGRFACDARVGMLLFFHWIDEADRDRMQTGLVRADGTHKAATAIVQSAVSGGCRAAPVSWTHTTEVVDAKVDWRTTPAGAFAVKAGEDFTYSASIVQRGGAKTGVGAPVRIVSGAGKAYWNVPVKFKGSRLRSGRYAYTVTLRSAMNPERVTVFTGRAFRR